MMETTESLGYLKGLLDGLDLDDNKKETKVYKAIIDVLSNLAEDIADVTESMDVLAEQIDAVDGDLGEVEEYLMGDDACGCCDEDDCCEVFEVECPLCGEEITVDEDTVLSGTINCPNCGEKLEFECEYEDEDGEETDAE